MYTRRMTKDRAKTVKKTFDPYAEGRWYIPVSEKRRQQSMQSGLKTEHDLLPS